MDCSPPGPSVHGILQAGTLEKVPFPPLGDLPYPGMELESPASSALAGGFFTSWATWEAHVSMVVFKRGQVIINEPIMAEIVTCRVLGRLK